MFFQTQRLKTSIKLNLNHKTPPFLRFILLSLGSQNRKWNPLQSVYSVSVGWQYGFPPAASRCYKCMQIRDVNAAQLRSIKSRNHASQADAFQALSLSCTPEHTQKQLVMLRWQRPAETSKDCQGETWGSSWSAGASSCFVFYTARISSFLCWLFSQV